METQAKIPPRKEGAEFLSQSHFNIGNDDRFITKSPYSYMSTSHKDYPPQKNSKVEPAITSQHASIMHKDARVNVQKTINKDHFGPHLLPQRQLEKMTLSKTNFKMDFDKPIDGYQTTNKLYHYPMHSDLVPPKRNPNPMKSYIPQGDEEKVDLPKSDYRDKFEGKPLVESADVAVDAFGGTSTIQGDPRSHLGHDMYDTTNNRELPLYSGHRKADIPADQHYPKTSIPSGKEWSLQSTQKEDYKFPSIGDHGSSSKNDILKTNYKVGDNRLNSFKTTMGDYVAAVKSAKSPIAKVDMSKSSFPEGDGIPTAGRAQTTLNREHFLDPPVGFTNPIIDGSNLHTASKVDFGRDPVLYESTMKSGFTRLPDGPEADGRGVRSKTMKSNFTLAQEDFHGMGMSSYREAYKPTDGAARLVPNPVAIDNLKKSYIRTPVCGLRELRTTQRDAYTKKEIVDREVVDTGRLHRSNMPFAAKCR